MSDSPSAPLSPRSARSANSNGGAHGNSVTSVSNMIAGDCLQCPPPFIARMISPRMSRAWGVFVLLFDLSLRFYDTFSDFGVAVEYYQQGFMNWFFISVAILCASALRLGYLAILQEKMWIGTWKSPRIIFQGILGALNLRPLVCVWKLLWGTKFDLTSPAAFQQLQHLEQERFEEGLFETMLQLFLQAYVFFIKIERGDSQAISWLGISSVIVSIFTMSKTLLERFPSRARALSLANKVLLFVFILCGVISRCVAVIGITLYLDAGFLLVFPAEILFILFIHVSLVKWHKIDWFVLFAKIRPMSNRVHPSDTISADRLQENEKLVTIVKSAFLTVLVFCPLSISYQISAIHLELETLSLISLLWAHSMLGLSLLAVRPTPNSDLIGYVMCICVFFQLFLFQFHNHLIQKITKSSFDFMRSLEIPSQSVLNSYQNAGVSTPEHFVPASLPGEVDVGYVENGESILMAVGRLHKFLCQAGLEDEAYKAKNLGIELLRRGADPLYDNEHGQSVFLVSNPEFDYALITRVVDMTKSGITYTEEGDLILETDRAWEFIEPYIIKGLGLTSFKHPDMDTPFYFSSPLHFENAKYSERILSMLFQCLEGSEDVEAVDFSNFNFTTGEQCSIFKESILANNSCKELSLEGCSFPDHSLYDVLDGISRNQSLEKINLSNCKLRNDDVEVLIKHMEKNRRLKQLNLSKSELTDAGFAPIWDKLLSLVMTNYELKDIDFSDNVGVTEADTVIRFEGYSSRCTVNWEHTPAKKKVLMKRQLDLIHEKIKNGKESFLPDMATSAVSGYVMVFEKILDIPNLPIQFTLDTPLIDGQTALMLACHHGQLELVDWLLKRRASLFPFPDHPEWNALGKAIDCVDLRSRNKVISRILNSRDCHILPCHIRQCMDQKDFSTFQTLVRTQSHSSWLDPETGESLLFSAVQMVDTAFAKYLLDNGHREKIDLQNKMGKTVLAVASEKGFKESVEMLLLPQNHANPTITDHLGNSPLHLAAFHGYTAVCAELIAAGSDLNLLSTETRTPLDMAVLNHQFEILRKILLSHKEKLSSNTLNAAFVTAWQQRFTGLEICELLIRQGGVDIPFDYLTSSIEAKNREEVKLLLSSSMSVNVVDAQGRSPLGVAVTAQDIFAVTLLINNKQASTKTPSPTSSATSPMTTPIHRPSSHLDTRAISFLLANEASPHFPDAQGQTPLFLAACIVRSLEITRVLMGAAKSDKTACLEILKQVWEGQKVGNNTMDMFSLLLEEGAPTSPEILKDAVREGNSRAVGALLDFGENPNLDTYLCTAVESGDEATTRVLLDKKAKLEIADQNGDTALHIATRKENRGMVSLLLSNFGYLGAKNKEGGTPQQIAVQSENHEILEMLLKARGGKPTQEIVQFAIRQEKVTAFEIIMSYGKSNISLNSEILWAAQFGEVEWMQRFLDTPHVGNINCQDEKGNTALHFAVQSKFMHLIEILIDQIKTPLTPNFSDETPLDIAMDTLHDLGLAEFLIFRIPTRQELQTRFEKVWWAKEGEEKDREMLRCFLKAGAVVPEALIKDALRIKDVALIGLLFPEFCQDPRLDLTLPDLPQTQLVYPPPQSEAVGSTLTLIFQFVNTIGQTIDVSAIVGRLTARVPPGGFEKWGFTVVGEGLIQFSVLLMSSGDRVYEVLCDETVEIGEIRVRVLEAFSLDSLSSSPNDGPIQTLKLDFIPFSMAISPSGALALTDFGNKSGLIATIPNVILKNTLGAELANFAQFSDDFDGPQGVEFSTDGTKLFVASQFNDCVCEIDLIHKSLVRKLGVGKLKDPFDLAFSESQNSLFVCDKEGNSVLKINLADGTVKQCGTQEASKRFDKPCGIAIDDDHETLAVVESSTSRITFLSTKTGSHMGSIDAQSLEEDPSTFLTNARKCISYDPLNGWYVVGDSGTVNTIFVFTAPRPDDPSRLLGIMEGAKKDLQSIMDLVVGRSGEMYVLDRESMRVQIYPSWKC